MCLIIDSNLIHSVFPVPATDLEPVYTAIIKGRANVVYGGRLADEYRQSRSLWRFVLELDRGGRARQAPRQAVDREEQRLAETGACCSDDHHVIALARVTGTRLLCSRDGDLCDDFKDPRLLSNPRGQVYRDIRHRPLIRRHCPDPQRRPRH